MDHFLKGPDPVSRTLPPPPACRRPPPTALRRRRAFAMKSVGPQSTEPTGAPRPLEKQMLTLAFLRLGGCLGGVGGGSCVLGVGVGLEGARGLGGGLGSGLGNVAGDAAAIPPKRSCTQKPKQYRPRWHAWFSPVRVISSRQT